MFVFVFSPHLLCRLLVRSSGSLNITGHVIKSAVTGPIEVRHIGPPTFLFQKQGDDKKGQQVFVFRLHKRPSYNCIMQSEESTTTTEALETMHYTAQAQGTGVLDPSTIEQGAFEAAMDHQGGHGLKRQADSDDDADAETTMLEEERPKKKTRGRVKIEMKFISNKLRRYTTFSKRKTGIMKKVGLIKLMLPDNCVI